MEKVVTEVERKLLLKKSYLARIDNERGKVYADPHELNTIIRDFFAQFLKLDYEFTYEELELELEKTFITSNTKTQVTILLETLTELTYLHGSEFSDEQTKTFLAQLRVIINLLIPDPITTKKQSFLGRLFKKDVATGELPNIDVVTPQNAPDIQAIVTMPEPVVETLVTPTPVSIDTAHALLIESEDPAITAINTFIEKIYAQYQEKNYDRARKIYLDALHAYRALPQEQKEHVFIALYDVYLKLSVTE
jgi:hypothetical protein